jgi:hypothetical protein
MHVTGSPLRIDLESDPVASGLGVAVVSKPIMKGEVMKIVVIVCQDPRHQVSALGRSVADTTADQSRRYRACEQARPNGLGNDG